MVLRFSTPAGKCLFLQKNTAKKSVGPHSLKSAEPATVKGFSCLSVGLT
jgi:hypothetical protein